MRLNRYCHAASELGLPSISSLDGCKGMLDSFVECLADGECPYCEQYADAASNSTNSEADIETDDELEEVSDVESTATTMPSPASTASSGSTPTKSPSLTSMPSLVLSGSPSVIGVGNTTDSSAIPTLTSTLSPSAIGGGSFSNVSGIPTQTGNESIVETIEPTALATENSTTHVPTVTPTGTLLPSYSPTTLKPTLGPCDGDSCPGEMCRSTYGFCGSGPSYCDENPIWTPECGENSKPPSPSPSILKEDIPTLSPADLDSVFLDDGSTITPTISAAPFAKSSFIKPSGGKKPLPSSSKTSPSPSVDDEMLYNAPTLTVATDSPTQATTSPTPMPSQKVFSPTDPEATYYCGVDWDDANASCLLRCPSSKSEDCPSDQKCFAFTSCMDDAENDTDAAANENDKFELTPEPNEVTSTDATNDGCNGKPCPFSGECRSQYGFCGKSFIYCNDLSSWTLDACGLVGRDKTGKSIKCDTEVFKCADGDEEVYKDPANACEFFPCPNDEEEESVIASTSFHTPGLSPSQSSPAQMPDLPKPTLPTITNASPFALPTFNATSTATIDLGKTPAALDNAVVVVDVNSDIADDGDQSSTAQDSATSAQNQNTLTSFSADEWLMNSSIMTRGVTCYLLVSLTTLSMYILLLAT
jgi:hypothetical protein